MIALAFGGGETRSPRCGCSSRTGTTASLARLLARRSRRSRWPRATSTAQGRDVAGLRDRARRGSALSHPRGIHRGRLDGRPRDAPARPQPGGRRSSPRSPSRLADLADVLDGGAARLREPLDELRPFLDGRLGRPPTRGRRDLRSPSSDALEGAGAFVFPPVIALEARPARREAGRGRKARRRGTHDLPFVLPGVAVYALFLVGDRRCATS